MMPEQDFGASVECAGAEKQHDQCLQFNDVPDQDPVCRPPESRAGGRAGWAADRSDGTSWQAAQQGALCP